MGSYTPEPIEQREDELLLTVHVLPSAAREQVGGLRDGALLVRVTSPPERGRANEAACRALARALAVKRSSLTLVAGATSRRKRFRVSGVSRAALDARIARLKDGTRR